MGGAPCNFGGEVWQGSGLALRDEKFIHRKIPIQIIYPAHVVKFLDGARGLEKSNEELPWNF